MTRIVHIITRLIRGGADENTLLSCNAQAEAGNHVHLIYGDEVSGAMLKRLHPDVRIRQVGSLVRRLSLKNDIVAFIDILRCIKQIQPDIVHTHTSKAGIIGRLAAVAAGTRGIVHGVHILPFLNVSPLQKFLYLWAERAVAPFTHAFVNVSDGMRQEGLRHRVGQPSRHWVIPSGMDVQEFAQSMPVSSNELLRCGIPTTGRERIIVMVAALERRKRIWEFIGVLSDVLRNHPSAHLVVLGEGNDRARIEDRAKSLRIDAKVHLLGFRDDVARWIKSADICVLSSEREGLPRSVVQYVVAAKPVVSTALPGIEAVVKHGATGYLVPVDRVEQMGDAIERLLADDDLARSFSDHAKAMDMSAWGVDAMVRGLDEVYAGILADSTTAPVSTV